MLVLFIFFNGMETQKCDSTNNRIMFVIIIHLEFRSDLSVQNFRIHDDHLSIAIQSFLIHRFASFQMLQLLDITGYRWTFLFFFFFFAKVMHDTSFYMYIYRCTIFDSYHDSESYNGFYGDVYDTITMPRVCIMRIYISRSIT